MFSTILSRCTVSAAHYTKSITALRQFSSEINFSDLVKKNKVVVFMKGSPDQPRCGFSRGVVQVLRVHGVDFDSHDVLTSKELREDWPTLPQVYMNGEFIGGCDIIMDMHQNGELIQKLEEIGIKSALTEDKKTPSEN